MPSRSVWRASLALYLATAANGQQPVIRFREVAKEAGIAFRHDASRSERKLLLEAMGAGVAMFDYDLDGLQDLYFVNGASLSATPPASKVDKTAPRFWNRLYRNRGDWRFEDVTERAGVQGRGYGMGAVAADYDGDGDPDLLVTNFGANHLFQNQGDGTFLDVAQEAGIAGNGWSSGAAFLDFDGDGLLDLFVARYLDWSIGDNRPCGNRLPLQRSYCHPREFAPVRHTLYRNLGEGLFEDHSDVAGLTDHRGKGLGVAVNDYDGDGWPDVFVANDSYPQQLFRNIQGRVLEESALMAGTAYDDEGREYAGMGVAWEDFDGDLRPDLVVNALGRQGYWLYANTGEAFETRSRQSGLASLSELASGWGMGLEDLDNDGWRDLFVGQGHVMDDIAESDPVLSPKEPLLLARNLFGRLFNVAGSAGDVFLSRFAARGVAFGDLDGDGRLDVAINVSDGPALVLQNRSQAGHSLAVRLIGQPPNRDAIGATVRVKRSDGRELVAYQATGGSYLSSGSMDLSFGLGMDGHAASISVSWPGGVTETFAGPATGLLILRQASPNGTGFQNESPLR